jgi:small-conductance mechanosensitive channel
MLNPLTELTTWSLPAAAALGGLGLGIVVRRTVLPWVARAAAKSAWKYDDALVEAVNGPIVVWFVLAGLRLAARLLPLAESTDWMIGRVILIAGILSVTWATARFASAALRSSTMTGSLPGVSLLANIASVVVFLVGLLIVLQNMGIAIGPIIGALGVGGLAVGLALQDTLANLFAGIRILAAHKIRPGDFIRLDNGLEGVVHDITWSLTTIRQLADNLVIVPNGKLAQMIVTNISLPLAEIVVPVTVGVAYDSDLEKVERVTIEVAREAQASVEGASRGFEPAIRFHTLGESAIQFNVTLQAGGAEHRGLIAHEFIKRLTARYRAEGIVMPYPTRTVVMKQAQS